MFVRSKFLAAMLLGIVGVSPALAGTYSFDCGSSKVNCKDLFADLVPDKFTTRYDHRHYQIFVYSAISAFSDGAGVTVAIVGVTPTSSGNVSYFPNRQWRHTIHRPKVGNAYDQQELLKSTVRKAIESMMAECENQPQCDIDGNLQPDKPK
jgi:hypothetical protein